MLSIKGVVQEMEWLLVGIAVLVGWYFFQVKSGDVNLKKVRALTFLLEKYGAALHGVDEYRFQQTVKVTTLLRTGIHALQSKQAFLVDEEVLGVYEEISSSDELVYHLLKDIDVSKIDGFKYAFRDCHERLKAMCRQ